MRPILPMDAWLTRQQETYRTNLSGINTSGSAKPISLLMILKPFARITNKRIEQFFVTEDVTRDPESNIHELLEEEEVKHRGITDVGNDSNW